MSKQRVTLSLEKENIEWLDNVCNNRSGYVNEILAEARKGDYDTQNVLTVFERRKLEIEEKQLKSKLEAAQNAKEELETMKNRQDRETWKRAVQNISPPSLRSIDTEDWAPAPDSNAVERYADELGITPEEFVKQYPDKRVEYDA